jgi:hypothetical protein
MDEQVEIHRGKQAQSLLQNELMVEAFTAIEEKYSAIFRSSLPTQHDVREHAYTMLYAAKEFRQLLTHFLETGKMASTAQEERMAMELREHRLNAWDGSPDGIT